MLNGYYKLITEINFKQNRLQSNKDTTTTGTDWTESSSRMLVLGMALTCLHRVIFLQNPDANDL